MPNLAQLADFADLTTWPGVIVEPDAQAAAEAVLDATSAYIRLESGDLSRWPARSDVPDAIRYLAVQVAARVWRNPDCAAMVTTGPFSEQFAQGVQAALYLTDDDRRVIARAVQPARAGLWSQPLTRGDDPGLPFLFDTFTGERVPRSPYPGGEFLFGGVWETW